MNNANRGKVLENLIEFSNNQYRGKELAVIQKIPTPVKVLNATKGKITGFYEKKSTVDYVGVYKTRYITFDAKETEIETRFNLSNISEHQYEHLKDVNKSGGISFLIVSFVNLDTIYFLPFEILKNYWENSKKGGRKSIPYKIFEKNAYKIKQVRVLLDYLKIIDEKI